ncbi:MAG: polyribonucleotide nucleotidyltransferase [Armatimonadetes bacterium]|nr:polyribonucleotide nucleotidyltransferase [Candidatus Hippobium faecium]
MSVFSVEKVIEGIKFTIETGKLAHQANGAVTVRSGDTVVFASACMAKKPKEGMDFFPLTVDVEERKYASGKISGGFNKRDGKPSERAILTSRLIDRPMRPLFPDGMRNDVQIVAMPLSIDPEVPYDIISMIAASAAVAISDIPWDGPLGAVRVCEIDGELVVNPSNAEQEKSNFELVIAGYESKLLEIELEAKEVKEDRLEEALTLAHKVCDEIVDLQKELIALCGKPKADVPLVKVDEELFAEIYEKTNVQIDEAIRNPLNAGKEAAIFELRDKLVEELSAEYEERADEVGPIIEKVVKKCVRRAVIKDHKRADGRALDEIRPLSCEVGVIPRVHGNGLFKRGQTQVMTTLTLGSIDEGQKIDNLEEDFEKNYIHYYNFPPYSVGEARPMRSAGRREIGHGALAEKALRPVIPSKEEFPYTMILVSDTFESNGSTSMASTCGSTLALMHGGIKIKAPVAGISIGVMSDENEYVMLTDIQGLEDFTGDMDFKVAGTRDGITAIQVDTKTKGLSRDIVSDALRLARDARYKILDLIEATIPEPAADLSPYAPRVLSVTINPEKIGDIIGPGGKIIKAIETETGAKLAIEQDGSVFISSSDLEGGQKALEMVKGLAFDPEVNSVFEGKITRIESFGAFVEILPGKDGLLHISQITNNRLGKVEDYCKLGDVLKVRVLEVGSDGKIKLTHKEFSNTPIEPESEKKPKGKPFKAKDLGVVFRDKN